MNDTARELLTALRQAAVPEIENLERFDTGTKARRLWQDISEAAAMGDHDAIEVMDHVGWLGCQKVIHDDKRVAGRSVLIVNHSDGSTERRVHQAMRAVAKSDPATGERFVQQALWWSMSYDEITDLFDTLSRLFVRAAEKRAAFQRVVSAYDAHPEAANAGDACRLAGFDPSEIEITDFDIRSARAA